MGEDFPEFKRPFKRPMPITSVNMVVGRVRHSFVGKCSLCKNLFERGDLVVLGGDSGWIMSHVKCSFDELKGVMEELDLASRDPEEYVKRFELLGAL